MKKTLLISVNYVDNNNRFWFDSTIDNKKITFNPETDNIHKVVKELCENEDNVQLSYKGKPQSNVHRDVLNSDDEICGYETIGYIYRGKSEIYDRNMSKPETGLFDVWVTISEVIPFTIENLD
jgi:hypothetical protein